MGWPTGRDQSRFWRLTFLRSATMRFAALLALLVAAGIPLLAYFAALLWFTARSLQRAAAARPGAAPGETEPLIAGTVFLTAFLMMFVFAGWLVVYTVLLHR